MNRTDGGQRIATADGAMLADPPSLGNLPIFEPPMFEPRYWEARGALASVSRGRGSAWFIETEPRPWVLRHYRRGGLIARLSADRYVWAGEERVRAFAEWRLLAMLTALGLPVPRPVAARYQRSGLLYRCDLITERIVGAVPLSERLLGRGVRAETWRRVGSTLARFHFVGADHADLNAHNILIDEAGMVSVIDFDRGRMRVPGAWGRGNLARLRRSLIKIAGSGFSDAVWGELLAGYADSRAPPL